MGQFFKFLFASCLGVILAMAVVFGISMLLIGQMASQAEKPKDVKPNTILKITLEKPIPEKTNNVQLSPYTIKDDKVLGLHEIVDAIENAKEDERIKGIYLETTSVSTGLTTASTIRDALLDFKESGKFIVANSDFYSQGGYYMASVADKLYVNPVGGIDFRGFSAQVPFFKKMLDNIGVRMQVYYAGQFKSATEPYRRTEMSEQSRLQLREYLDEAYNLFTEDIADSREMSVSAIKKLADDYVGIDPELSLEKGLVDALGYDDEVKTDLRERLGLEEKDKLYMISLSDYNAGKKSKQNYKVKDKIAIVFAEGTIVMGNGENGNVGDDKYTKILNKIRKDDKIKGVVLRVNSPGGSALSSENILREIQRIQEEGKPVIVSMGDYAASGGYYIACYADSILAEPNTLTGSIGVFSMIPSAQELFNEHLGISVDTVKTGRFSTGITPFFDISEEEGAILQNRTDQFYETFLGHVAKGRDMTRDEVHAIAQGRVWTGQKAKTNGLVDALGGLDDAVEIAASMAGIEKYRTTEYPRIKDPLMELIEEITGQNDTHSRILKKELKGFFPYYQHVKEVMETQGVQARLPVVISN